MAKSKKSPEDRPINAISDNQCKRNVPDWINLVRDGFGFREYTDTNCDDLCHCDESGVAVYEKDKHGKWHEIAQIPTGITLSDIEDMTDEEFDGFLIENGIL